MPFVLTAMVSLGCATHTNAVGARGTPGAGGGVGAGGERQRVAPNRAHVALEDIEPPVAVPAAGVEPPALSKRGAGQLERARALRDEQRYTEALRALDRALRYDPNHPDVLRAIALVHLASGNIAQAGASARRLLEANQNDATAHYIVGRVDVAGHDLTAAITAFRRSMACSDFGSDPALATLCHYHAAEALAEAGYLEAALAQYERFEQVLALLPDDVARDPELVVLRQAGGGSAAMPKSQLLERLGRYADAADALAALAARSPGDVAVRLRYARLLVAASRLASALRTVRAIDSNDDAVISLLVEIHRRMGDVEGSVADLRRRLANDPDVPGLASALCDVLMEQGRAGDARDVLAAYLVRHVDALELRVRLIELLADAGLWSRLLDVAAAGVTDDGSLAPGLTAALVRLSERDAAVAAVTATDVSPPAGDSGHARAYVRFVLADAAGRDEAAAVWLDRCLRAAPGFVPARIALARRHLAAYRYDDAIRIAGRADADTAEDAQLELLLGDAYTALDDTNAAELHYKAALQLDAANTEAMFALARVQASKGNALQFRRRLTRLLEAAPDHEEARESLFWIHVRMNELEDAEAQIEALRRHGAGPTTIARCAAWIERLRTHDAERYRQVLFDAMESAAPDADTLIAIANSYTDFQVQQRYDAFARASAIDPENLAALVGLAEAEFELLRFDKAAERWRALLPRRPNRHGWRRRLIDIYMAMQDYDRAIALAEREAARADIPVDDRIKYRGRIISALQASDRIDEAVARLRGWAEAEPASRVWRSALAELYVATDRASLAVPIRESAYQDDPDDARAFEALVGALVAAKRSDRAVQYVLDWLADDPENDQLVYTLAQVLRSGGRPVAALELVRNRLLRTRNTDQFENLSAILLLDAKQEDACIARLETALEALHERVAGQGGRGVAPGPEDLARLRSLHRLLATVLIDTKQYDRAERRINTWLLRTRHPDARVDLLIRLREAYRLQGKHELETEAVEEALELARDNPGLNNDVAYTWIDRGVRLDEAAPMIRFAVSRGPAETAFLDTYGWLRYKQGAFADAVTWLERAVGAGDGEDPVIHDHLGDAYFRMGERDEAVAHWSLAVEFARTDAGEDEQTTTDDERRVRRTTQGKIDAVRSGSAPAIAPLAPPPPGPSESGVPRAGTPPQKP